jgi:hypothetical protein
MQFGALFQAFMHLVILWEFWNIGGKNKLLSELIPPSCFVSGRSAALWRRVESTAWPRCESISHAPHRPSSSFWMSTFWAVIDGWHRGLDTKLVFAALPKRRNCGGRCSCQLQTCFLLRHVAAYFHGIWGGNWYDRISCRVCLLLLG